MKTQARVQSARRSFSPIKPESKTFRTDSAFFCGQLALMGDPFFVKTQSLLCALLVGLTTADIDRVATETNGPARVEAAKQNDDGIVPYEPRSVAPGNRAQKVSEGPVGGGLTMSLVFDKEVYEEGDPIMATIGFRNVTNRPATYLAVIGVPPVASFLVTNTLTREIITGKPVVPYFGSTRLATLQPGWENDYDLRFDRYFSLGPGKYCIQATKEALANGVLTSAVGKITIKARPLGNSETNATSTAPR